ncbi:MAG TPA: cobalt-precorrin-5B (C(1))-methyltransferase [Nitrososphaeraceae archaeon]|nr:cobalt-precorrin-5B (C(1))-methyltransferase [Nitrososphaeraceae archaeon]
MSQSTDDIKESDLPVGKKKSLRTGYTTGTCAAAATKAALSTLVNKEKLSKVNVSLPKDKQITIDIAWIKQNDDRTVTAAVIKDGGDDPDVTNGAEVCSTVSLLETADKIVIDGGIGVGRVTKPGLGLEIGKAAINPTPLKMIYHAVEEILSQEKKKSYGLSVIISVPEGQEIAKKTDNPRLGILGGISILGTTGIVIPYSTASFAASIRQSIDVSKAMGSDSVILTTGGRSEDFARAIYGTTIADHAYIQIGDFIGFGVKQCAIKEIRKVYVVGFIGKITKMAMGIKQTHVKGSHVDMNFLADIASRCGADKELVKQIKGANTARHVSELIDKYGLNSFYDNLCKEVHVHLTKYSQSQLKIKIILLDFDGKIIGNYPKDDNQ